MKAVLQIEKRGGWVVDLGKSGRAMRLLCVFGTRPEAIKMAPIIKEMQSAKDVELRICVTGQHREMLDQVLGLFSIVPHYDLQLMRQGQNITDIFADMVKALRPILAEYEPDLMLVHGDTSSTLAAAMAATYARIPVGHVEAGLRTGDLSSPWPEEANRRMVGSVATLHFAPTEQARANLLAENVKGNHVFVTGNSVIDALQMVSRQMHDNLALERQFEAYFPCDPKRKMILVTGHRRENLGAGFYNIFTALQHIAKRDDVEIYYPVHLNPAVKGPVEEMLGGISNIHLLPPLDYLPFVYLMGRAALILTDSGGIQEEAPALGKPVLVMRNTTERPEAVAAGTVRLVGTECGSIMSAVEQLLDNPAAYAAMRFAHNPYGDGTASVQILEAIRRWWAGGAPAEAVQNVGAIPEPAE